MSIAMLTPATVHALLAEHDIRPKKSLGQNFLADPNTARRIVGLADIPAGGPVLEIGPGLGSLTLALVEGGHDVVAVEFDPKLAGTLTSVLTAAGAGTRVRVEVADALSAELSELLEPTGDWSSVSNLPYNIAVPVVMRLLEDVPRVDRLLVMVQREVGERLAGAPGDEQYGAASVKVSYFAEAKVVGTVPATVFVPRPRVESVLVRLQRRLTPPVSVPSPEMLFTLVRTGFAQRRKMLRRSLLPLLGDRTTALLEAAGVSPTARAEELGLAEWAALCRGAESAA